MKYCLSCPGFSYMTDVTMENIFPLLSFQTKNAQLPQSAIFAHYNASANFSMFQPQVKYL